MKTLSKNQVAFKININITRKKAKTLLHAIQTIFKKKGQPEHSSCFGTSGFSTQCIHSIAYPILLSFATFIFPLNCF